MIECVASLDDVIRQNSNLVYSICSKYQGYTDKEDLYQVGIIGLINAYNNFDKEKEVKFSTYAFPFVVGEVSKYVRENNNIKVSRDLIKLGKKINEYIEKHYEVRGYKPSIKDISLMLGVKEQKIHLALDAILKTKSLDETINEDGKEITLKDVTPTLEVISKEQMLDLKEAFKYLSEDEKNLLINRYYKDLTQSEIAQMLGVNQVYVSRLEKKALLKMKDKMKIIV